MRAQQFSDALPRRFACSLESSAKTWPSTTPKVSYEDDLLDPTGPGRDALDDGGNRHGARRCVLPRRAGCRRERFHGGSRTRQSRFRSGNGHACPYGPERDARCQASRPPRRGIGFVDGSPPRSPRQACGQRSVGIAWAKAAGGRSERSTLTPAGLKARHRCRAFSQATRLAIRASQR